MRRICDNPNCLIESLNPLTNAAPSYYTSRYSGLNHVETLVYSKKLFTFFSLSEGTPITALNADICAGERYLGNSVGIP